MPQTVSESDITASVFANILRVIEEATEEGDGSLSEEAQEEIDDYLELLGPEGMPELRHLLSDAERLSLEVLSQGDEWHIYQGPHGGKGWRNTRTGDVVYGGDKPGQKTVAEKAGHAAGKKTRALALAVLHEMKPSSILERLKQAAHAVRHPVEVVKKVKDKAVEKYKKLEERYGRAGAIAIVGAYAGYYVAFSIDPLLTMTYVPSPTAALLGSAEALRFATSQIGDVVNPPVALLSLEDSGAQHLLHEAKVFVAELAHEAGEPMPELDDDVLLQVMEALLEHGDSGNEDDDAEHFAQDVEWTAYEGPHGGRGWKNASTGEVLYQQERPGSRGGDGQADTPLPQKTQQQQGQPQSEQQDPEHEARRQQARTDYKQNGVRAKSFKAWFGDWEHDPKNASKVVDPKTGEPLGTHPLPEHTSKVSDETGKPIAVFHGTPGGAFAEFRKDKLRDAEALVYGEGFYFAEDRKLADRYAKGESGKEQGEVMTVFLNIRKPFRASQSYTREQFEQITGKKVGWLANLNRKMSGKKPDYTGDEVYFALTQQHGGRKGANDRLKQLGFDGIHTGELNGEKTNVWVAFESNQIKAADNEGTFDPNDNRIHMGLPDEHLAQGIDPWQPYQGKRGGKGWKHSQTGRIVYGATKPGGTHRAVASAAKQEKPTVEKVTEHAKRVLQAPTREGVLVLLDNLMGLKLADMRKVREQLGAAKGGKSKGDLAERIKSKVGGGAAPEAKLAKPQKPPRNPEQIEAVASAYDRAGTSLKEQELIAALEAVNGMDGPQLRTLGPKVNVTPASQTVEQLRKRIKQTINGRYGAASRAKLSGTRAESEELRRQRGTTDEGIARIDELMKQTGQTKTPKPAPTKPQAAAPAPEPAPSEQEAKPAPDLPSAVGSAASAADQLSPGLSRTLASQTTLHGKLKALSALDVKVFDPLVGTPEAREVGVNNNEFLRGLSFFVGQHQQQKESDPEYAAKNLAKNIGTLVTRTKSAVEGLRKLGKAKEADFYEKHAIPLMEAVGREAVSGPQAG